MSEQLPLHLESVVKTFPLGGGAVTALDRASLVVPQGEFLAVMGASGSGKSTLLHAAAGLTRVDSGRVLVGGEELGGLSDARLTRFRRDHVGLVFQAFNLIPTLDARDNILLPVLGREGAQARADDLIARLGLTDRAHHKPDALSGGEQQRVAIARALVSDPMLVLADEPTGSLDSATGEQICRLMRELCDEQNRTLVVVTHEPAVVLWADRVVVLRDGRDVGEFPMEGIDTTRELAEAYDRALQSEPVASV